MICDLLYYRGRHVLFFLQYQQSSLSIHTHDPNTLESLQHNSKNELKLLRILQCGNYNNILCSHLSLFPRVLTPSQVPSLNKCGWWCGRIDFLHNILNLINVKRDGYLPLHSLYEFDITTSRNINGEWLIRLQACRSTERIVAVAHYIKLTRLINIEIQYSSTCISEYFCCRYNSTQSIVFLLRCFFFVRIKRFSIVKSQKTRAKRIKFL